MYTNFEFINLKKNVFLKLLLGEVLIVIIDETIFNKRLSTIISALIVNEEYIIIC